MTAPSSDPFAVQRLHVALGLVLILIGFASVAWFCLPTQGSGQGRAPGAHSSVPGGPAEPAAGLEHSATDLSGDRADAAPPVEGDPAPPGELAGEPAGELAGDPLRAMLESLAEMEGQVLTAGQSPPSAALRGAIEDLLRPFLAEQDTAWTVIARLERGDFAPAEAQRATALAAGTAPLSRAEYGALRFLYWSIALAGSPASEWFAGDLGAARQRLSFSVQSLGNFDPAVGVRWAEHVGDLGERLPGLIDARAGLGWLEDLRLAGVDPDVHRALALALAPFLGDVVSSAYLIALVDELERPAELGRALQLLLESGEAELGLELALGVLERPGVDAELRAAVFDAVRRGAPVEQAVDFVAEHLELLGRPSNPFLGLGYRDAGPEALLERYLSELAAGSDPQLRRLLVGGLSKLDAARLEDIARHDGDLEVRSQALLKLFNQDDGDAADVFELAADVLATPEGAESLGEARFYLRGCLGTLLRRGEGESRSTALDYLRQLARTAGTSGARRQFLDVHAAHADPQVHRQFLIELGL
jgi:hypothetical protein